jgi:hypothetical protein
MDAPFRVPTFLAKPPTGDSEKTVVVLGAFRGGTSMVSQLLRELGVFMGERFACPDGDYDNAEDQEFQDLLYRRDLLTKENVSAADFSAHELSALRVLIEKRNRQHALWGWKYPGTIIWCLHAGLARYLRNPHFITVFRDPLAIFQHELDKNSLEPAAVCKKTGRSFRWIGLQNQRLVDHVVQSQAPHLLISYERTMTGGPSKNQALVESLISFLQPALADSPGIEQFTSKELKNT